MAAPETTSALGGLGAEGGVWLVGCGRMGGALLRGWLAAGLPADALWVREPAPAAWLGETGVRLGQDPAAPPAVAVLAVKPQVIDETLAEIGPQLGPATLVISVAAGIPLARIAAPLGPAARVIRAMPNTPAAIGQGVTAIVANARVVPGDLARAEALLAAAGTVERLEHEDQMDAVTALSGSGPAYVFHLIECLAAAGEAEGLPAPLALRLARQTVAGAGALAATSPTDPAELRQQVTSPGGTTAAGLAELMAAPGGLRELVGRTVQAAAARSRALGR